MTGPVNLTPLPSSYCLSLVAAAAATIRLRDSLHTSQDKYGKTFGPPPPRQLPGWMDLDIDAHVNRHTRGLWRSRPRGSNPCSENNSFESQHDQGDSSCQRYGSSERATSVAHRAWNPPVNNQPTQIRPSQPRPPSCSARCSAGRRPDVFDLLDAGTGNVQSTYEATNRTCHQNGSTIY